MEYNIGKHFLITYLHMRYSWEPPAQPRKKLTVNRPQFLGIITREYLDQIRPVELENKIQIYYQFKIMIDSQNLSNLLGTLHSFSLSVYSLIKFIQ